MQPHTPENVSVVLGGMEHNPFLRVTWEPPDKADTRSGWITLVYQLRVKLEKDDKWEVHGAQWHAAASGCAINSVEFPLVAYSAEQVISRVVEYNTRPGQIGLTP